MPTVSVSFSPLPAHVRTARLVALACARRAGVADDLLDEVRLAVGEACSRAVAVHASVAPERPVVMAVNDDAGRFSVEVTDVGALDAEAEPADVDDLDLDVSASETDAADPESAAEDDAMPAGYGLAVISGLVEDVAVVSDPGGTRVTMAWPLPLPPL